MRETNDTFMARMQMIFTEHEVERVRQAYYTAKHIHRWQKRKERDENGVPKRYFEHLRHVAIILVEEAGCRDVRMVIMGLFHDSLEDTRIKVLFLEVNYGEDVSRGVSRVSKVPKEGYLERLALFGDWETFCLKAADRLHNLRTLPEDNPDFCRKQLVETEDHYYPLFDRMVEECPPEERANMTRLRSLIHAEVAAQRRRLSA